MKMKKMYGRVVVCVLVFSMLCSGSVVTAASKKMKMNKSRVTVQEGKKTTLKLKGAKKKKVKWSSSNKKIATVKAGVVKAKKKGRCTITAKYAKKKYCCRVIVKSSESAKTTATPTATPTSGVLASATTVTVTVAQAADNERKLTITLHNDSDVELLSGVGFWVEKYEAGVWNKLDFQKATAFPALAMVNSARRSFSSSIDLEEYFVSLNAGSYRIAKRVYPSGMNLKDGLVIVGQFTLHNDFGDVNADPVEKLLSMTLTQDEAKKNVNISLKNDASTQLSTVQAFTILKEQDGSWEELAFKNPPVFSNDRINLFWSPYKQSFSLENLFGSTLAEGNYRVKKILYSDSKEYSVYADFAINSDKECTLPVDVPTPTPTPAVATVPPS